MYFSYYIRNLREFDTEFNTQFNTEFDTRLDQRPFNVIKLKISDAIFFAQMVGAVKNLKLSRT